MSKIITPAQVKELYNISKPAMPAPLHRWKLDEESAGPVIDSGSSPVNGTNSGAIINQDGFRGKCYEFDGSTSYVNGPVLNIFANPWTYSAWAKVLSTTGSQLITGSTSDFKCPRLLCQTTWISAYLSSNGTSWGIHSGSQDASKHPAIDQWNHMIIQWDGSYYKIYMNGEEIWSLTSSTACYDGGTFRLAQQASYYFEGQISDFRIYTKALNTREINDIYRGLA